MDCLTGLLSLSRYCGLPSPKSGVYVIINLLNDKIYVGSSTNIPGRFRTHLHELRTQKHNNSYLQEDWNKFGENSFHFVAIEEISPELRLLREQFWLDFTQCYNREIGYNICPTADFSVMSEETRQKMSSLKKGTKMAEKQRLALKEKQKGRGNNFYGKKHTEETKAIIGKKNSVKSPEAIAKLKAANIGKKLSEEQKRKISLKTAGKNNPRYGAIVSEETKAKMAAKRLKAYHFINPDNEVVTVTNLKQFCKDNNLKHYRMCDLDKKRISDYKGYKSYGLLDRIA